MYSGRVRGTRVGQTSGGEVLLSECVRRARARARARVRERGCESVVNERQVGDEGVVEGCWETGQVQGGTGRVRAGLKKGLNG